MRRTLTIAALGFAQPAFAISPQSWDQASNIGRDALVVTALGLPLIKNDAKGSLQAAASISATFLVTEALKEGFPERRPDGSDRRSFPSGHTSVSFAAAASLHNRYGWEVGLPAHITAAFVGFARVKARKHHWYDVIAGAAVGEVSGLLLTRKKNSGVIVIPYADTDGAGLVMATRF